MQKRVRAIIIKDNKILTIKRTKPDTVFWVMPGGGVEKGETNEKALIRETKEELGVDITVGSLFWSADSKRPETIGHKEYFYFCDIKSGKLGSGNGPEFHKDTLYVGKYDIEWIDIDSLKNINLRPAEIKDLIYKRYKK
ncbi:NUDIX domain-containing protein [Patescibacteria group bacterium]|nr:NUDIX domain-containing protein [Patescibacteria group bacterium]MBU4367625.1 NUDIX domain-containing protein [Patescibacteria group bacterium]MBU4462105.1 NUDIX domain-containing protein [Patescibacteria group bacterium]MCG2700424.1 NUDIX domain-containing protein [Candidatus Parcubacteria bacterium]